MEEAGPTQANSKTVAEGRVNKRKRYDAKPERSFRRDERRELMSKAKSLWEALRPKATGKEKSQKLVAQLIDILSGRIVEFVFRHDGSRIVQWMLSDGSEQQKTLVLNELIQGSEKKAMPGEQPFFVRLASDRYGKHLATKLLRITDKTHCSQVYSRYLRGNVSVLMKTVSGADTLDIAFQTIVTAAERSHLVLELLFSKEPKLLDGINAKLAKEDTNLTSHDGNTRKVKTAVEFANCIGLLGEGFKNQILESAAATLNQFIDKETLLRMNIVHCALKEYFEVVMKQFPASRTQEMAGLLAPSIVHLTHTRAGANVAISCVKVLDAKHRKKAVRSLKSHVRKIAEDEYGHRVLLAFLEWMDDTKIVGSIVYTEILSKSKVAMELAGHDEMKNSKNNAGAEATDIEYLTSLCRHKYGRMLILHLLVYKQTRYFNPDVYGHIWAEIDCEKFGKMSKKNPNVRSSELLDKVRDALKILVEQRLEALLGHHFSAPVAIGALQEPLLKDTVALAVAALLNDEEKKKNLKNNVCSRKTLCTLFKIGEAEFANKIIDICGANIAVDLAMDQNCIGAVRNLLMATEKSEAAQAVVNAKSEIKKAAAGNEKSRSIAAELLKRAQMLTAFDSIMGGAIPQ